MLRPLLIVLVKGPPLLLLAVLAVYVLDLGGGRQPIIDAVTAGAHAVGAEMSSRIAPTPSPTPTAVPVPAPGP